ncbi:MAG: GGDEF domain-containing protein [Lachnospiraceae bacterium]|nr:GGDEF domain-containing protein [Lachnospiraceae bacterium]
MKKKIAVCANGWNYETLSMALDGIKEYAEKKDFDVFTFMSFASYSEYSTIVQGELNIYKLMDPTDYDGVIVFSTHLNSERTAISLCREAKEKNVPVVSIGMEIEGIPSVYTDNRDGMRELVTHLIEKHNVKRAFFIGGTPDHVDSVARLETAREVMEEHGLSLSDKDVGYGKWSNRHTADLVDKVIDSERGLPDAFICANDVMAMSACTELEIRGYEVPKDVIVTGFDDLEVGKDFYPALSSVGQNYKTIGLRACELIFENVKSRKGPAKEMVHSDFICAESCGCDTNDYEERRKMYCRHSYLRNAEAKLLEQNERVMRQWLSDMPDYQVMKETLRNHYKHNHQFEGDGFYIVVDGEYFEDVMASEKELWERGRESRAEVLVALKDGEIKTDFSADWKNFIPGYEKKDNEQHIYFIVPLHYFEFNYGYIVLTDRPIIMNDDALYPYLEKLQQAIKMMRINLRLKALYDKDQMTGLLNRFGYEEKALPLYEESLEKKTNAMVMFVDINYMKRINDEYGHIHGDNAIKTVVAAINENTTKEVVAVRFGGDEFLILAPDCSEEKAAGIKKGILDYLSIKNESGEIPYKISVSIGYVVTDPKGRPLATLQDYIKEADKLMYDIKKEMHKENDRRH